MTDNKKVPAIRFKGFSDEWEERKLSDMTDYSNGKGHEDKQSDKGNFELINLNSISIDGGLKHSGKFIDEANDTLLKDDLVMVLSDVGHGDLLGRVAIIPENDKYVLNQRVALLRPNGTVFPLYLFYNINSHQKYFKSQGAGMSQLNISKSCVEDFQSYIPSLKEQISIGTFFQHLDHLITLQQSKYDKTLNIKKAMLEKMFPKEGAKVPEIRFEGFSGEWEKQIFSDVFDLSVSNNTLSRDELNYENGIIKNIHYGDVLIKFGSYIDITNDKLPFITNCNLTDYKNRLLRNGDIIMADTAEDETAGKVSEITNIQNENISSGLHTFVCRPKSSFKQYFLGYYMNSQSYHHQLLPLMQGIKVLSLSRTNISKTYLQYPKSLEEQTAIGSFFQQLDTLINSYSQELDKLKNIKKALLEKMFV